MQLMSDVRVYMSAPSTHARLVGWVRSLCWFFVISLLLVLQAKSGRTEWVVVGVGLALGGYGAVPLLLGVWARRWKKGMAEILSAEVRERADAFDGGLYRHSFYLELTLWQIERRREVSGFGLVERDYRMPERERVYALAEKFRRGRVVEVLLHPFNPDRVVVVPSLSEALRLGSIVIVTLGALITCLGAWLLHQ